MTPGSGQPAPEPSALSDVGTIARAHDPDRFLTALFVPPARREAIFTVIAFNHEIARALDVAASSRGDYAAIGGHIRLQWWREVVEGDAKRHQVATPLAALLEEGAVGRDILLAAIDARATELDGFTDEENWLSALRDGPGGLARAIAQILGAPDHMFDAIADLGAAYAVGKILRHLPTLRATGRRPMPDHLLDRDDPAATIAIGRRLLAAATPRLPREQRAACLLAVFARRDLARAAARRHQDRPRGAADRLAVATAYLTGRQSPLFPTRISPPPYS